MVVSLHEGDNARAVERVDLEDAARRGSLGCGDGFGEQLQQPVVPLTDAVRVPLDVVQRMIELLIKLDLGPGTRLEVGTEGGGCIGGLLQRRGETPNSRLTAGQKSLGRSDGQVRRQSQCERQKEVSKHWCVRREQEGQGVTAPGVPAMRIVIGRCGPPANQKDDDGPILRSRG
jgi:hypothetical protein